MGERIKETQSGFEERLLSLERTFGKPVVVSVLVENGVTTFRACADVDLYDGDDSEPELSVQKKLNDNRDCVQASTRYIG